MNFWSRFCFVVICVAWMFVSFFFCLVSFFDAVLLFERRFEKLGLVFFDDVELLPIVFWIVAL